MTQEAGHHPGRSYIGQDGAFHLNGAAFYDSDETDISTGINVVGVTASAAEINVLDGVTAGTAIASGADVRDSSGNLLLPDNYENRYGTGADLQVGWNGTYTYAKGGVATQHSENASGQPPSKMDPNFNTIAFELFDDFMEFDPTATVGNWVTVEDDAADTQALSDDVAGGVIKLTQKATTDDDAAQISHVCAPFLLAAGKHLWYEARFRCAAGATQIDVIAGLVALGEDMTGVADNRFQDGIGFFKTDGSTTVQFGSSKNGTDTGTNTNVGTLGTSWHTIGFYVNGVTSATPYFDGVAGTAITATFCDDESLAPIFMVRNGDNVTTQTLEVDYVRVVQLR